ncbi:MAG: hypothetical protein LBD70_07770, partial [Bifidobacteriaceae bacterium]|nr:hypothetical protein [Bifidobacteriaceae bacterium]
MSIPQVVLVTADRGLADAASRAIWEAGAAVQCATAADQVARLPVRPRLAVCGQDVDQAAAFGIVQAWPDCQVIWAGLGESAWGASECLVLPESERRLTQAVEAIHRPAGGTTRLALIAAHGGAGASCLAVALAARLGGGGPVRLAGLNRAGSPIGCLLGVEGPAGAGGLSEWAAALEPAAEPRPFSPPVARGIELISGRAPPPELAAWQIRAVLEDWEALAPGGHTLLDAGPAAPGGAWRVASWADHRVLVARADPAGAAALAALAADFDDLGLDFDVAVREVPGGLAADEVAHGIGGRTVVIGDERGFVAGLVHGLTPGERARGKLARAAGRLAKMIGPEGVAIGPGGPGVAGVAAVPAAPAVPAARRAPVVRGASAVRRAPATRGGPAVRGVSAARGAPGARGGPAVRGVSGVRGGPAVRGVSAARGAPGARGAPVAPGEPAAPPV